MNKKILWVGLVSLVLIIITGFLTMLFVKPENYRGTAYNAPYPPAPDFELTRSNGETFRLSGQQTRIILLFFGYTFCPDVCPATLAELNSALGQIPDKADAVEVVFVSVDPERDTPQKVQEYVDQFNPAFIGLSGSLSELQKIWQDYGIFREVVNEPSGLTSVTHTARVILIDMDGKMRLSYAFGTPVKDIVHDLTLILK